MTQINIKNKKSQDLRKGDIIINFGTVLDIRRINGMLVLQVDQTILDIKPPIRVKSVCENLNFVLYSSNQE